MDSEAPSPILTDELYQQMRDVARRREDARKVIQLNYCATLEQQACRELGLPVPQDDWDSLRTRAIIAQYKAREELEGL